LFVKLLKWYSVYPWYRLYHSIMMPSTSFPYGTIHCNVPFRMCMEMNVFVAV